MFHATHRSRADNAFDAILVYTETPASCTRTFCFVPNPNVTSEIQERSPRQVRSCVTCRSIIILPQYFFSAPTDSHPLLKARCTDIAHSESTRFDSAETSRRDSNIDVSGDKFVKRHSQKSPPLKRTRSYNAHESGQQQGL